MAWFPGQGAGAPNGAADRAESPRIHFQDQIARGLELEMKWNTGSGDRARHEPFMFQRPEESDKTSA
jgi:hypothetical protein